MGEDRTDPEAMTEQSLSNTRAMGINVIRSYEAMNLLQQYFIQSCGGCIVIEKAIRRFFTTIVLMNNGILLDPTVLSLQIAHSHILVRGNSKICNVQIGFESSDSQKFYQTHDPCTRKCTYEGQDISSAGPIILL